MSRIHITESFEMSDVIFQEVTLKGLLLPINFFMYSFIYFLL